MAAVPASTSRPRSRRRRSTASDGAAEEALHLFCVHLGRLAGNLALAFMARGGVYLAGGIAARIAPFIAESGFRAAFIDKAPHQALMDKMPTFVVTHPEPALAGLTACARDPERLRRRHRGPPLAARAHRASGAARLGACAVGGALSGSSGQGWRG